MLLQHAPLPPGSTRVQLTVIHAQGVKVKPYPPGWLIWSGGVKCFYKQYKCFIFKVKEWEVIELAFVKEYNILKNGQGMCCHLIVEIQVDLLSHCSDALCIGVRPYIVPSFFVTN